MVLLKKVYKTVGISSTTVTLTNLVLHDAFKCCSKCIVGILESINKSCVSLSPDWFHSRFIVF